MQIQNLTAQIKTRAFIAAFNAPDDIGTNAPFGAMGLFAGPGKRKRAALMRRAF